MNVSENRIFGAACRLHIDLSPHIDVVSPARLKGAAWTLEAPLRGLETMTIDPDVLHDAEYALPGRKHLIFGNHDVGHPMHKKWAHTHPGYDAVFTTTSTLASLTARKTRVLLSHFPYPNPDEDRYQAWRPLDTGLPLIHGHTHSTRQQSFSPHQSPQLHVGLDAWNLTPVPFGAVDTWLKHVLSTPRQHDTKPQQGWQAK